MDEQIRVLHVDDEPDFVAIAAEHLEWESDRIEVTTATTAAEGLDRLATNEIDCVVADYRLTDTDGIEFLDAAREREPAIPFILFTGKGDEEVASSAITAAVTDYVRKQDESEQWAYLADRIEEAVDTQRARREAIRSLDLLNRTERLADTGGWEIELSTDTLRWTEGTCRIHDVPVSYEPSIEEAIEFYHPDDRETIAAAIERCREEGTPWNLDLRIRTASGRERWLRTTGEAVCEDGVITALRGAIQDITDRKRRERELEHTTERLDLALEAAEAGIWDWDVRTDEVYFDDRFADILGYDREELEPNVNTWIEKRHPEDTPYVLETLNAHLEGETEYFRVSHRLRTKSGGWKWIRDVGQVVDRDEGGEPIRAIGIIIDIDEEMQRRRELSRQKDRLEEFAHVVSHDLRNPLNVAMGRARLAATTDDREHVEHVIDALERMDAIIEDTLTLAREGQTVAEMEPIDLVELIEASWGMVETDAATLSIAGNATIYGDRNRLKQVLENLVGNAIEHGATGNSDGESSDNLDGESSDNLDGESDTDAVRIRVGPLEDGFFLADDGPGIPAAQRDRIFGPGYTTAESGTGFGLSIVHRIVTAHGWEIDVTESADGGARFEITGVEIENVRLDEETRLA